MVTGYISVEYKVRLITHYFKKLELPVVVDLRMNFRLKEKTNGILLWMIIMNDYYDLIHTARDVGLARPRATFLSLTLVQ